MTTNSQHRATSHPMTKKQILAVVDYARHHPDLTQREIAESFGCSTGTCGAHIRKAKKEFGAAFYLVDKSAEPKSMYEKVLAIYRKSGENLDTQLVADQLEVTRRQVLESLANLRNRRDHIFSYKTNEQGQKEFKYEGEAIPEPDQANRLPPSSFKTAFSLMSI